MKILHLCFSPRGLAGESSRLSSRIVERLLEMNPDAQVLCRTPGVDGIPQVDADYAFAQGGFAADTNQSGSSALSEALISELEASDALVIGTPMHNLGVPSTLKAWIDHVVRARRTFNVTSAGKIGMLGERRVFIAVSSGGRFSGEQARQPDFLTPYLKVVLGTIGLTNISFISVEGTGHGQAVIEEARMKAAREIKSQISIPRPIQPT